jgi:hypothetical protein
METGSENITQHRMASCLFGKAVSCMVFYRNQGSKTQSRGANVKTEKGSRQAIYLPTNSGVLITLRFTDETDNLSVLHPLNQVLLYRIGSSGSLYGLVYIPSHCWSRAQALI